MARLEPIMWIDLDTREITEVPRDSHGKYMTSDRGGALPTLPRLTYRYMVRFMRVPAPLLGDWLNPKCHDCEAPATTMAASTGTLSVTTMRRRSAADDC